MSVQNLLEEVQQQGIELQIVGKEKIKYRSPRPVPRDLLKKLKEHKPDIIRALKHQTEPEEYPSKGQSEKIDSRPSQEPVSKDYRYCEGYNPPRTAHLGVCQRHIEQADPHCVTCKHITREEQEAWMDAYLDKAIARLNALYKKGDRISWTKRKMVDELEAQITKAFLAYDLERFKELVDQWKAAFTQMRQW